MSRVPLHINLDPADLEWVDAQPGSRSEVIGRAIRQVKGVSPTFDPTTITNEELKRFPGAFALDAADLAPLLRRAQTLQDREALLAVAHLVGDRRPVTAITAADAMGLARSGEAIMGRLGRLVTLNLAEWRFGRLYLKRQTDSPARV